MSFSVENSFHLKIQLIWITTIGDLSSHMFWLDLSLALKHVVLPDTKYINSLRCFAGDYAWWFITGRENIEYKFWGKFLMKFCQSHHWREIIVKQFLYNWLLIFVLQIGVLQLRKLYTSFWVTLFNLLRFV